MTDPDVYASFEFACELDRFFNERPDAKYKALLAKFGRNMRVRKGSSKYYFNLTNVNPSIFETIFVGQLLLQKRYILGIDGVIRDPFSKNCQQASEDLAMVVKPKRNSLTSGSSIIESLLLWIDQASDFISLSLTCKFFYSHSRPAIISTMERLNPWRRLNIILKGFYSVSGPVIFIDSLLTPKYLEMPLHSRFALLKAIVRSKHVQDSRLLERALNVTKYPHLVAQFIEFLWNRGRRAQVPPAIRTRSHQRAVSGASRNTRCILLRPDCGELSTLGKHKVLRKNTSIVDVRPLVSSNRLYAYAIVSMLSVNCYCFKSIFLAIQGLILNDPELHDCLSQIEECAIYSDNSTHPILHAQVDKHKSKRFKRFRELLRQICLRSLRGPLCEIIQSPLY